jgi:thiol-disulfide isomerase/thioredoxin
MSKILDLFDKYLKPYYLYILITFVLIIFIIAGYYGYKKYAVPSIENDKYKDVSNANRRNKEAILYFFYADWCPHCRKAKPEWNSFKQEYDNDNKLVNGYRVVCKGIDCTKDLHDDNCDDECRNVKKLVTQYQVDSYPTVKLINSDGETIEFDSKISKNTLEQFVNTVLQD